MRNVYNERSVHPVLIITSSIAALETHIRQTFRAFTESPNIGLLGPYQATNSKYAANTDKDPSLSKLNISPTLCHLSPPSPY